MLDRVAALGRTTLDTIAGAGAAFFMLMRALIGKPNLRKSWPLLMQQMYSVGVLSLVIIVVSGLFIGMVLGLQGYTIFGGLRR